MNQRKAMLLSFFIVFIIVVSYAWSESNDPTRLPNPRTIDGDSLASTPPVEDAIRFVQNRIRKNTDDVVSYTLLGELYIRQARETGNVGDYQLAEESLLKALDLLPTYSPAGSSLASVYYSQHEFEKAYNLAGQVYADNPKNSPARILMADSRLSLGNYEQAEMIYDELAEINVTPPLLARIAYLEELKGDSDRALELMRQSAAEALHAGGTKESVAWYLLRVGDLYFNRGEIKESGEFYEASLRVFQNYPPALAGLGKVRAAEGDYEEAIKYYQHAVSIVPQPDFLAALGDVYMANGQEDQARIQYETVETIGTLAALNQQVYNRQLANFYSDHDTNLDQALDLSLAELELRRDIYGYDAAAWAHYKNGNYEEAQDLIEQALTLGTRDARLYFHAGMITLALGNDSLAREYLEEALEINPYFSIVDSVTTRATLKTLQATAGK